MSALGPETIQRVGPWPVKKLLGQGGFSWVFEVEDEKLGVSRALKMLRPEAAQGEQFKRFWNEARILASIQDPHLVTIFALDQDATTGCHYYVMEYLTGSDLAHQLREGGALPFERAVPIFLGALQGLARLHAIKPKPIIHRDLKPANIQITEEGRAKLLDLGIARVARSADETVQGTDLTGAHGFIGTPKYASPEQLGQRELGPPSDVFAMGICLFEALEGRHPYTDMPDLPTLQYTDILMFYGRLSAGNNELGLKFDVTPKPLREVIRKALHVRARERYQNAQEMRDALERALRQAERGASAALAGTLVRVAAGLALVAALGAGGYWAWTQRPGPDGSGQRAAIESVRRAASALQDDAKRRDSPAPEFKSALDEGRLAFVAGENALRDEDFDEAARQYARANASFQKALSIAPMGGPAVDAAALRRAAEQREAEGKRDLAYGVKREVDARLADKTVDAQGASDLAKLLADADLLAGAKDWAGAAKAYEHAASFGKSLPAIEPPASVPVAGLEDALAKAVAAREAATEAGADQTTRKDFEAADQKLAKAQALPPAQGAEALRLASDARTGFERATGTTRKMLDDARGAKGRAEAASRKLPSPGSCNGLANDAQTKSCQEARRLFDRAEDALAKSDGDSARTLYAQAEAKFADAISVKPPTLALAGPASLEIGQSQEVRANASDPSGGAVAVTFSVRTPSGARESHDGPSFRFEPEEEGRYTIEAVARNDAGKESPRRTLAIAVKAPKTAAPVTPVEPAPPAPQVARVPPPTPPTAEEGDVKKRAQGLIREYESAIESRDIDALNAVWGMDSRTRTMFEGIFETYPDVKASTVLRDARSVSDEQMELRFTQVIQVVQDGKLVDLAGGLMRATAVRRGNAWQIKSLVRDGGG